MPEPALAAPRDERIRQIVAAILRIADRNFDTGLIPSPRRDETDAIIVGINAMATELAHVYADLDARVAERTALLERAGAELEVMAYTDPLTRLSNRSALMRGISHALDAHRRGEAAPVLMLLDLDAFKRINDTLGHAAGDEVLVAVGERLRGGVRPGDQISRLGGDEFAILLAGGCPSPMDLGRRLVRAINEESLVGGVALTLGASLGIAEAGTDHDPDQLLLEADTAMYEAKRSQRGKVKSFEPYMLHERRALAAMIAELRHALGAAQIFPAFQPIVDLTTGRWIGAEALCRWERPGHGLVEPRVFLQQAEDAGLLPELTATLLNSALEQLARWRSADLVPEDFAVHLNVSSPELHALGFPDMIRDALRAHGVPPRSLALEITEHRLMSGDTLDRYSLLALQQMGVSVHIDDFGTGYSSISYLSRLPIAGAKVDMELVKDIVADPRQRALLAAVRSLLDACALECIVEGVESAEQVRVLADLGFDRAQGFHFGRPATGTEFVVQLSAQAPPDSPMSGPPA
ncbi:putative bifunctional diguanylate cyclase/phosphodiesterase [Zafaria sp. Z1313]|uniref:putative bifunctional diguanylate cyclase/phosphodiesterase n=1 Tax=Zafaria sp. Z1313 TaxID=3423202 RepID=UPI003D30284B